MKKIMIIDIHPIYKDFKFDIPFTEGKDMCIMGSCGTVARMVLGQFF
jgi:hypothetical protein